MTEKRVIIIICIDNSENNNKKKPMNNQHSKHRALYDNKIIDEIKETLKANKYTFL